MAKLTIGQKADRTLSFLMGLRNRRVASVLAAHGFTSADTDEGWRHLQALTKGRLDVVAPTPEADPSLVLALDAWENRWFPIVSASLRARFPEAHAILFNNLTQTEGLEVIVSVSTLLSRIEALSKEKKHKEVLVLLKRRGVNDAVIADAKRLLAALGKVESAADETPSISAEEDAALEQALWDWYLEWSGIARAAIKDRRELRALGFLTERGGSVDDSDTPDEPPVVAGPPGGQPRIEPGMPGSDPFAEEDPKKP